MKPALKWILLLIILCGCDETGDNFLDGSLADSYKMDFDSVRVRLYPSELSIEYVQNDKNGEKVSLRVTLTRDDAEIAAGQTYDLKELGTISRGQGFNSELPELKSGELKLENFASTDGSDVKGTFEAIFLSSEQNEQTLRGGFAATLEVVTW